MACFRWRGKRRQQYQKPRHQTPNGCSCRHCRSCTPKTRDLKVRAAPQRLLLQGLSNSTRTAGFYVIPPKTPFSWTVRMFDFGPHTAIGRSLHAYAHANSTQEHICIQITFDDSFPARPPRVRLVWPVLMDFTGVSGQAAGSVKTGTGMD